MNKTALIFPGQGVQVVGMGRAVAESCPASQSLFKRANDVVGFDLQELCFHGPAERLSATDVQQPAIYTAALAIWEALRSQTPGLSPAAAAGLSLGEYMALTAAGSLRFEDGLRLVQQRGRLMQAASETRPSGMATIIGLDRQAVQRIVEQARQGDTLVAANFLADDLIVVSGERSALDRACQLAEASQARVNRLDVAGAFHSPLMEPAARALGEILASIKIAPPQLPVVSNVTGDYHKSPPEICTLLQQQVIRPVEWSRSIQRLAADGCRRMIAIGPGASQRTIVRRIDRSVNVVVVETPADIGKV